MLARHSWFALAATAAATLVLASTATPANAVIGGTDDTANHYQNVGMLQLRDDDEWFAFCSGTLVADNVVLTAAHCLDFFTAEVGEDGLGPDDLRVSFAVAPDEDSTYYLADHVVVHPGWLTAGPCLGNSKHLCLAPPAEDIGLIFLTQDVSAVTPAQLAPAGYLDTLDLTHETFTTVGYGTDAFITGSAGSPNAITIVDGVRSFRNVSVITTHDAFPDRHLKITKSVCFGDSGGPLFHGDTLVALNTWTFSYRCDGPNLEYRVDAAAAQEFLSAHL